MVRTRMNFQWLSVTDVKIDINRVPNKNTFIKAVEDAGEAAHK